MDTSEPQARFGLATDHLPHDVLAPWTPDARYTPGYGLEEEPTAEGAERAGKQGQLQPGEQRAGGGAQRAVLAEDDFVISPSALAAAAAAAAIDAERKRYEQEELSRGHGTAALHGSVVSAGGTAQPGAQPQDTPVHMCASDLRDHGQQQRSLLGSSQASSVHPGGMERGMPPSHAYSSRQPAVTVSISARGISAAAAAAAAELRAAERDAAMLRSALENGRLTALLSWSVPGATHRLCSRADHAALSHNRLAAELSRSLPLLPHHRAALPPAPAPLHAPQPPRLRLKAQRGGRTHSPEPGPTRSGGFDWTRLDACARNLPPPPAMALPDRSAAPDRGDAKKFSGSALPAPNSTLQSAGSDAGGARGSAPRAKRGRAQHGRTALSRTRGQQLGDLDALPLARPTVLRVQLPGGSPGGPARAAALLRDLGLRDSSTAVRDGPDPYSPPKIARGRSASPSPREKAALASWAAPPPAASQGPVGARGVARAGGERRLVHAGSAREQGAADLPAQESLPALTLGRARNERRSGQ